MLKAGKAREEERIKREAIAGGLAMNGKKGVSELNKMFPGHKRRSGLDAVLDDEQMEHPLGMDDDGEGAGARPAAYEPGEDEDFLGAVKGQFAEPD